MEILYIAKINPETSAGVLNKINDQVTSWNSIGNNIRVRLIFLIPYNKGHGSIPIENIIFERNFFQKFFFNKKLYKTVCENDPDSIYIRFSTLPLLNLLILGFHRPIFELNTKFEEELKHFKGVWKKAFLRCYYNLVRMVASAFVSVTPECLPSDNKKHSLVLGNSFNLSKVNLDAVPKIAPSAGRLEAVFMGSPGCPWHGVDKLVQMAFHLPDVFFHIVGYQESDVKLTPAFETPENVHFHGYCNRTSYEPIIKRCSVAIGSLAMERNNMQFSSSLKNREYLAYGLPLLLQGRDLSLTGLSFVQELPMNFDLETFRRALGCAALSQVDREAIFLRIDASIVERLRLDFISAHARPSRERLVTGDC